MTSRPERPLDPSEILRNEAEAKMFLAQARKESALAKQETDKAAIGAFDRDRAEERREKELATDEKHHLYRFVGSVGESSVRTCINQLEQWHRLDRGCEIEIEFFSPGGEVISGMALFDRILQLRRQGHHVATTAAGYAASMGGILLQAGDHRAMHRESYLLLHEISAFARGKLPEMEDEIEFMKMIEKRVLRIFSERSKLSAASIKTRWRRKDWWLDSDEALKFGFVDEVR